MLYSCSRLGSLLPELNASTFRSTALGLTAAAAVFVGTAGFSASSAIAQQQANATFTDEQCRNAKIIGNAVSAKYNVSPELAESFVQFGKSKCDLNTNWRLVTPADEKAFGEFRLKLIALRTADAGKPRAFAAQ